MFEETAGSACNVRVSFNFYLEMKCSRGRYYMRFQRSKENHPGAFWMATANLPAVPL